MATILPKKSDQENPIATDDDHHEALAADPSITQFPQGSSYGTTTSNPTTSPSGGSSAFNSPATAGFGASSGFNAPTSFGGNTGFGAPTSGFGSNTVSSPPVNQPVLTGAGSNAAQGADVLVANTNEDWINKKWRPVMGWVYMMTCTADFVVFPILWSLLQAMSHGQVTSQWQPLTLQGAGLYHIAMGAVLGIAAYGRTKEKLESKQ
jgi:hypothetical protein